MVKHVYILGAGFSRPLGGPLFTDLLSLEYLNVATNVPLPEDMAIVLQRLHAAHSSFRSIDELLGRSTNPLSVEDLLALVEWCVRHPDTKRASILLQSIGVGNFQDDTERDEFLASVNKHLKRLIACQCNTFAMELEVQSDIVAPYIAWVERLTPDDTIITFNYDVAVEELAIICDRHFPTEPATYNPNSGLPRLIHMHGCVDWVVDGVDIRHQTMAYMDDVDLCIGMPGMAKATITDIARMNTLWSLARQAISAADIVSIVGYRMPASDNKARQDILNALKGGQRVNVVLGDDSFSSNRMQSLMQPIVGTNALGVSNVVDLKMYAQDYLPNVKHYLTYDYTLKTPR